MDKCGAVCPDDSGVTCTWGPGHTSMLWRGNRYDHGNPDAGAYWNGPPPAEAAHPVFTHRDGTKCIWLEDEPNGTLGYWFTPYDVAGDGAACGLEHPKDDWIPPVRPMLVHHTIRVFDPTRPALVYTPDGAQRMWDFLNPDLGAGSGDMTRVERTIAIATLRAVADELELQSVTWQLPTQQLDSDWQCSDLRPHSSHIHSSGRWCIGNEVPSRPGH